jgi:predicted DNA-binding mobile mystery protein A
MRNKRKLLVEQLDRKIKPFQGTENVIVPDKGWINSIRITLNITLEQFGRKLNMTRQGAKKVEESEAAGTVSLNTMKKIGQVLNMRFVYGFVPISGSIENLIEAKAEELAKKIILRTHHTMILENQGNSDVQINKAIKDLTSELKRELDKSLWD